MLRVVSLFCGLGGWDMGLYRAAKDLGLEVEVVAAYDHWEPAVKAYNANLPHPVAQVRDLKAMQRDELPPHDLVIGGPPCQPFSLAGKRKGHGDERNCLPDFREMLCHDCGKRIYGDGRFINDNFLHLCNEYDRRVYEGMKSKTLQCREDGCTCAYGHQGGFCMKCGHLTKQEMLNA